jgi:hypothetical protein
MPREYLAQINSAASAYYFIPAGLIVLSIMCSVYCRLLQLDSRPGISICSTSRSEA